MGEWERGGQAVAAQEEAQTPRRAVEQREGHREGKIREEGALGSCAGGGKGKGMWELVKQQGSWHRTKPLPADTLPSS